MKVVFLFLISFSVFCQEKEPLNFIRLEETNFEAILKKAKTQKKLIFIDVYTVWCGPCKILDRTTLVDSFLVKKFNKEFILLKVNAEGLLGSKIAQEYRVDSYPTLLFVKANRKLIHRMEGVIPAKMLIEEAEFAKKQKVN
jgi:thioredoxin 1